MNLLKKRKIFLGVGVVAFTCLVIGLRAVNRISGDHNGDVTGLVKAVLVLICMIVTWVLGYAFKRSE